MTTLQIHAKADAQGTFHLELPGFSHGSEADLTIIVTEPPSAPNAASVGRFSRFCGALKFDGDPVAMQRELRDEW